MKARRQTRSFGLGFALLAASGLAAQNKDPEPAAAPSSREIYALADRTLANQRNNSHTLDFYERIERIEDHKNPGKADTVSVRVYRAFPAAGGFDHIPLGPDGKPTDAAAYQRELQRLEQSLAWSLVDGSAQRAAYARAASRKKETDDFLNAIRNAYVYTWVGRDLRNGRTLAKIRLEPNPDYKPTSRLTAVLAKLRGVAWVDESAGQLAHFEAEVAEDISFVGGVVAKVYKGGRFVLDQDEIAPGIWQPTFSQVDLEGRKFLFAAAIHSRMTTTQYRRVGPPKEAIQIVRAELNNSSANHSNPSASTP